MTVENTHDLRELQEESVDDHPSVEVIMSYRIVRLARFLNCRRRDVDLINHPSQILAHLIESLRHLLRNLIPVRSTLARFCS